MPSRDPMPARRTPVKANFRKLRSLDGSSQARAVPGAESAEQCPQARAFSRPVAAKIAPACRASARSTESRWCGQGDERLRGSQRIAVGVVGPVHGQARASGPGRRARPVRRSRGGCPRSRRSSRSIAAVSTRDSAAPSPRSRGRRRESRARRSATCATSAPPASAARGVEHLVERRRVVEVRLAKAVDADRVAARHPLRPHQLVAGIGEGGPSRRDRHCGEGDDLVGGRIEPGRLEVDHA